MPVARLVDHQNPESRETPLLLLAALRDIDPSIELVYFGARDWRLGAVRSGEARDYRAEQGDKLLDHLERARAAGHSPSPKNFMLAYLLKQGFAQIAQYRDHGDPAGLVHCVVDASGSYDYETTILHDFRERDFNWRRDQGEAVVMAAAEEASGLSQRREADAKMRDYLATDARDHYARHMRGRIMSGAAGVTGGSGKLLLPDTPKLITGEEVMASIEDIMRELSPA